LACYPWCLSLGALSAPKNKLQQIAVIDPQVREAANMGTVYDLGNYGLEKE
jgi:hypothetical protein